MVFSIILFAIGLILGVVSVVLFMHAKTVGDLRIETSDEDGPFLFLELSRGTNDLVKKKYVILKVNTKNILTRR